MDSTAYNLGRADWSAGTPDADRAATSLDYRAGMADERGRVDTDRAALTPDQHLRARVAAGAEWLDQVRPDWVKVVRLDGLDMDHRDRDIFGWISDQSLGPDDRRDAYSRRWDTTFEELLKSDQGEAIRLGLLSTTAAVELPTAVSQEGDRVEYVALTEAWRDEILKRWH